MSKKTKKIPPMERIATSLDSIDGTLRRIAEAKESHSAYVSSQTQVYVESVRHSCRPWWKKLLGIA